MSGFRRAAGAVGLAVACVAALVVGVLVLRRGAEVRDTHHAAVPAVAPADLEPPATATEEDETAASPEFPEPERAAAVDESPEDAGPAGGLRVLVLDGLGLDPIEGAAVEPVGRASSAARRTDAGGVCRVPLRGERDRPLLSVSAGGYVPRRVEATDERSLVVVLERAAEIHGRVLDGATLAAVPGARITLVDPTESIGGDAPGAEAVADGLGRYTLADVPLLAAAELEVRAEGYPTQRIAFELAHDVGDAGRIEQDLRLGRGLELEARVEDHTSGRGLAGARIGGLVADERGHASGRVAAPPGSTRVRLEVAAEGHATLHAELDLAEPGERVFRLPRVARLSGEVRGPSGPIEGARVGFVAHGPPPGETSPLYELPDEWRYALEAEAESDADGRYALDVLPWSLDGVAKVTWLGLCEREVAVAAIGEPGSDRRLDFWLGGCPTDAVVRGRVRLNGQHESLDLIGRVAWRGLAHEGGRSGAVVLDDGVFEAVVEPGTVALAATLEAAPHLASEELVLEIAAGEARDVVLDVVAPLRPITGWVVSHAGDPLGGVTVNAYCCLPADDPHWGLFHRARTDERGAFELLVTDIGLPYELELRGFDGGTYTASLVPPGARDVELEVPGGGTLYVRVIDARTGEVLAIGADVQLVAREEGGRFAWLPMASALPDPAGWRPFRTTARELELLALPAAPRLAGLGTRRAHVRVDAAEPPRVELELASGAELVLVLAEGSEPFPDDHELLLIEEELLGAVPFRHAHRTQPLDALVESRRVLLDAHGRARLSGLAPGRYGFQCLPDDVELSPARVDVHAGEAAAATIEWRWRP